jgi:hypothetical protein
MKRLALIGVFLLASCTGASAFGWGWYDYDYPSPRYGYYSYSPYSYYVYEPRFRVIVRPSRRYYSADPFFDFHFYGGHRRYRSVWW